MKDFSNVEAMVEDLYHKVLTYIDKNNLRKSSPWTRRRLNNGELGRLIRNKYGFWLPENPLTNPYDKHSDKFPDNLSAKIIEKLYLAVKARWDGL